jgi:hypothetical protein
MDFCQGMSIFISSYQKNILFDFFSRYVMILSNQILLSSVMNCFGIN